MKPEDHKKAYEEHREALDWAINRGIEKSQRTIGLHISRAIIELLSLFLHKQKIITMGFQINHRWFKSEKVGEKFPNFSQKEIIIEKLTEVELKAEALVYGKQKTEKEIKAALNIFLEAEKILLNLIGRENDRNTE